MNDLLKYVSNHYILKEGKKPCLSDFQRYAYYENGKTRFSISFKKGAKCCTFKCRKDGDRDNQQIEGMEAYRICKQYAKGSELDLRKHNYSYWKKVLGWDDKENRFAASAKPILYYNPKYERQRIRAYSYDINSSYSNGMIQDMPDTSVNPKVNQKLLDKNELGFYIDKGELVCTEQIGKFCDFIFPRIESPFKRFVEVWYNRKKNAKSLEEKEKAKEVLNYSIGYYQKINPFIRARVISYANKIIIDLMDENTLLCNTDSIISLVPRNDLIIGKEIGQFKEENKGTMVAYIQHNYQWDLKVPTYRGIPKKWFPKGWDILKHTTPDSGNLVEFNPTTGLFEEA